MNNDETLPELEPNRCPECGGLRSIYADDCVCRIATLAREAGRYQHALATALRFLVNPRLRPEDIHAGMTCGGTMPAPTNDELLRLADALEGR